MMADERNNK